MSISLKVVELERLEEAARVVLDFVDRHTSEQPDGGDAVQESTTDLCSMKKEFCNLLATELGGLREAIASDEWERVTTRANQAVGDAGLYGLAEVSRLAKELEKFARLENSEGALEAVLALENALQPVT